MLRRILLSLAGLLGVLYVCFVLFVLYTMFLSGFGLPPSAPEVFVPFLLLIPIGLPLYFLPAIIGRRKRNARAILVLNLIAGWTLLGWAGALIWALLRDQPVTQPVER